MINFHICKVIQFFRLSRTKTKIRIWVLLATLFWKTKKNWSVNSSAKTDVYIKDSFIGVTHNICSAKKLKASQFDLWYFLHHLRQNFLIQHHCFIFFKIFHKVSQLRFFSRCSANQNNPLKTSHLAVFHYLRLLVITSPQRIFLITIPAQ